MTGSLGLPARIGLALIVVIGTIVSAPTGFGILWFIPYAGVGALLVIRRPGTSIGWLLLGIGWCLAMASLSVDATPTELEAGTVPAPTVVAAIASAIAGMTGFLLFAALAIVFPRGRLPAGRWRRITQAALAIGAVLVVATAVAPVISVSVWGEPVSVGMRNPAAILPELPIWRVLTPDTTILPIVSLLIVAVASMLGRFRRAVGVERQQLQWITAALGFVVVAVLCGFVSGLLLPGVGETGVAWLGAVVAFPTVAIAVGIAVLRYRLYEIDRIVSRTIGWLLVTLILGAVFAAVVVGLQAALAPMTGNNTLAVAASTLVAAALFQPLRARVQRGVDRRFDRSRVNAERTLSGFGERARVEVDLPHLRDAVVGAAAESVHPARVGLWLRP